jgi:hypothetical protein
MSWVEWNGESWPSTDDQASLRLYLWPPDYGYPRASWHLELFHLYRPPGTEKDDYSKDRWIDLEITELFFHEPDWRRLAGHEIHATPEWHATHEHFTQHHQRKESRLRMNCRKELPNPTGPSDVDEQETWHGHDFTLRFGARDGLCFPCELDAWLIHEDEYERTEPETEIAPFASTPPNLRILTRALFEGGTICVPRSGHRDPIAAARKLLEEAVGYDGELHDPKISWALRRNLGVESLLEKDYHVVMHGLFSNVGFSTGVSVWDRS